MKKIISIFIVFIFSSFFLSCVKYINTEYIVSNTCSDTINTHVCGMTYSSFYGEQEKCFDYAIAPLSKYTIRELEAKENVSVNDIFTEFEITKNNIKSSKDPYDISLWTKETTVDKITYTLKIDSTFFE